MVQTGPPARGGTVLRTLWVSASEATLGRSAPLPRLPGGGPLSSAGSSVGTVAGWALQRGFPADDRGGARLSLKKVGGKNTRGKPLDPGFMARSLSLARFGDRCLWYDSGAISSGMPRPIWDAFSRKICWNAFLRKKVPKSGHTDGCRNSPTTGTMRHNRQNERVGTSGL